MKRKIQNLVNKYCRIISEFTLVDLGASGTSHQPFEFIKNFSTCIEFDPDERDFLFDQSEKGKIKVNKAITANPEAKRIPLYLTKDPHCTSILQPIPENAHEWPYGDSFELDKIVDVPAVSLDTIFSELNKKNLDWIKIDIQGADGRVINSINNELMNTVLVCETEPGYCNHYKDADSFGDIHSLMLEKGFFLAAINNQKQVRMRSHVYKEFVAQYSGFCRKFVEVSLLKSPTAPELLYIRSIKSGLNLNFSEEQWLKLWLLSIVSGHLEYAYDVAKQMQSMGFGNTNSIINDTLSLINIRAIRKAPANLFAYFRRKLGR